MPSTMSRLLTALCILWMSGMSAQTGYRSVTLLDDGWRFYNAHQPDAKNPGFDDSAWDQVTVPHDWAIGQPFIKDGDANTGKLPWKGQGWYRLVLPQFQETEGRNIYLVCDGIMAFPKIYINGQLAGKWDYGYNSFYLDITSFLKTGAENLLAVHVDTRPHDSRWYPGAGIFRKIYLLDAPETHIEIWGTQITTPVVKNHYADVRARSSIKNRSQEPAEFSIKHSITNQEGHVITEAVTRLYIAAGKTKEAENNLVLPSPQRWDVSNPKLYTMVTELYREDKLVDRTSERFGVRSFHFTPDNGFYLNDRRLQLKGVNLHHDHGPLGAAFNYRSMQRQLQIMKSMGCNAIRTSHNTAAPELLDLCDEMGFLVFNEVFDKYDAKAGITDTTDFNSFALRQMRHFVTRDRNHPSVFLWSVGNEIGDVQWNIDGGFAKLQTMINYLHRFDHTRPVTLVCDSRESARLRHFDYYDIHAWNYGRRYSLARMLEPGKSVIISESASTLSSRGHYELPLPEHPTDFSASGQLSSYDLHAPWWAELPDDDFMWQQEENYIAGEFVWTGFDYLGEPTPYNNEWVESSGVDKTASSRSSYFGIVDLCGLPKDRYYLYKSYWKPHDTTIHILPHWNWQGQQHDSIPVFVYTNGDCADLFVNGQSLGRRCKSPKSDSSVQRFRLIWDKVPYIPGEVKTIAYRNGVNIGERSIYTADKPRRLILTADRTEIKNDGHDLSFIVIEARDEQGHFCPRADMMIDITLSGPGRIEAVCNGNPQSYHPFKAKSIPLFNGKAVVIIRGEKGQTGQVSVEARASDALIATTQIRLIH